MFFYPRIPFIHPHPQVAVRSDIGPRHENQDNFVLINGAKKSQLLRHGRVDYQTVKNWPKDYWRLCVIDGMGGHQGGKAFAQAVAQALLDRPWGDFAPVARRKAVVRLHHTLREQFYQHPQSPGSTLLWVDIKPSGRAIIAHLGDSRLWLRRDQVWQSLTHDHSMQEFRFRDGEDNKMTQKNHVMAQALGFGSYGILADDEGDKPLRASPELRLDLATDLAQDMGQHADVFVFKFKQGDELLIATDGLWSGDEAFDWQQAFVDIKASNPQPDDLLARLFLKAQEQAVDDNLTAIYCRF